MTHVIARWTAALVFGLLLASPCLAQAPADDPARFKPAEPDFTLIGLPTSLRLPKWRSAFRVTHRFTRPLGDGDFGDLAGDLFGIDSGARIGLEFRIGICRTVRSAYTARATAPSSSLRSTDLLRQGTHGPLEISALFTIDGTDNFTDSYSPAIGVIVSRTIGEVAALVFRADLGEQHQCAAREPRRPQRHVHGRPRRQAQSAAHGLRGG